LIASAVHWAWRADGLVHLVQDGHDLPRGPLGLLLYLPLALLFPLIPRRARAPFLTLSSYLLLLLTLGPGYALTLLVLAAGGFGLVSVCARTSRVGAAIVLWSALYALLIFVPQPAFLPPIRPPRTDALKEPLYFYLHWAGIGYVFLKTVHVLVDVSRLRMPAPDVQRFLAYLFFAPTVRMGPIYRYPEFAEQMDSPAHRDAGAAAIRIAFGLLRLGVMSAMLKNFPIEKLFESPGSLPAYRFIGCLYAAPLSIYLWISGYVDISLGMGLLMGFRVPENFNYPWKAASLAEFWRRWHLTLGSWLRDYVYIPLGGNRRHVFLNYFVTFLFCGVWHGLYLSYALWGISQGVGLAVNRSWSLYWKREREMNTPLYRQLARWRLVSSPLNATAGWLFTFHYQILTIAWFMDEEHAGRRIFYHLVELAL
jgi:D-alanyl-lipoteichoic acid acyltransferase DltB (MBOAT superfamily)